MVPLTIKKIFEGRLLDPGNRQPAPMMAIGSDGKCIRAVSEFEVLCQRLTRGHFQSCMTVTSNKSGMCSEGGSMGISMLLKVYHKIGRHGNLELRYINNILKHSVQQSNH